MLEQLVLPQERGEELAGIPCYFQHVAARRVAWAYAAQRLLHHIEAFASDCKRQSKQPGLGRHTRARLKRGAETYRQHLEEMRRLLAPLQPERVEVNDYFNLPAAHVGPIPDLVGHYVNLHRDWAWQTDENGEHWQLLRALLPPDRPLGRVLALGAGACRLPYELHRSAAPELTVVTDVNPLLFLCARKILRGETLELFEFPALPIDLASYAVKRTLRAPEPVGDNFHWVLTDATAPCFQPASFDTVVTPWLIDVVGMDIHAFFPLLNRLLKPNGVWLNLGPLMFPGQFARFYSYEETLEAAERAGFAVELPAQKRIPYLQSPADAHHRSESVVTFRAIKREESALPATPLGEIPRVAPPWLTQLDAPVELSADLEAMALAHQLCAEMLERVDGRRSVQQISAELSAKFDLPTEQVAALVQRCFANVVQSVQGNPVPSARPPR